jgi:hypothetical protein
MRRGRDIDRMLAEKIPKAYMQDEGCDHQHEAIE